MNPLANLATDKSINEAADSVGADYSVLDSGVYAATVTLAYLKKAASGAMALALTLKTAAGREFQQTLWMTSGTAKGGKNYYEKDGERFYLPGFTLANHLCMLTLDQEISQLTPEVKVISLYSPEAKAEVPTKVDMFMDLIGKEVFAAVFKQTVDKTKKNDAGVYEPTGETRDENEVDKFFHSPTEMTVAELRAKAAEATFINTWKAKNEGKTKMKAKSAGKAAGGTGPVAGAFGAAANTTKKPASSLFAA